MIGGITFLSSEFWPGFWRAAHRPLMLCAVLAALVGPWIAGGDPQAHARLLVFGFAGAAIGAYLLTVLPGWSKVRASPTRLALLTGLWVLGRLFPGPVEALYFLVLAVTVGLPLIRTQVYSRLWAPLAPLLLALATLLPDLPNNSTPLLLAALVATVGARALPAFLASASGKEQPADRPVLYAMAPILILGFIVHPHPAWLLLAALVLTVQMFRWHLLSPPLGAVLLPPWLWLIASLVLMAVDLAPSSHALHMLTIGTVGGMILAFIARIFATRGGPTLVARPASLVTVTVLHVATAVRLLDALPLAASLWSLCWAITLVQLICHCRQPPQIPVFIGSRRKPS